MKSFRPRVRLLQTLIGAASLLLVVKVAGVAMTFSGLGSDASPISVARAEGGGHGATKPSGESGQDAAKPEDGKAADACDGRKSRPSPGPVAVPVVPAAAGPTPQEIEILQQLAQRREALDARAGDIDRHADILRAAEARLDQKLKEMKDLQVLLDGLIKKHDEQQEAQLASLVRIYENMKPKDAARILEELDMNTLLPVAERMNERKLAPVMAEMNPAKAKAITEELAKLRQLVSGGRSAKAG